MKILYGIQGTGNGHISRARIMAKKFNELGISIDYLFSGREPEKYFDMQEFGDYQTRHGVSFSSANGQVKVLDTIKNLRIGQFWHDVHDIDLSGYDLVLNDFEPITAWAAHKQKKTCMAISHQASFLRPVPIDGASWSDTQIIKHFAPSDIQLGVHWYHFGYNILPPFIEPVEITQTKKNKILVYLPFESLEQIEPTLASFSDYEFYCYHPDATDMQRDNIHFRALSRTGFKQDMADCEGVIANAGFELSSEAICFGKRLLLKPLTGQFEQSSNAHTLELLGLASVMHALNLDVIESWLSESAKGAVKFPSDPKPFIDWLYQGDWHAPQSLINELWQQVEFPEGVFHKLNNIKAA